MGTVLIADDEPNLRDLLRASIESDDVEIVEAGDGEQAWGLIRERQPSVAILDVMMPGASGLELTRAIRAEPTLAHTRVLLVSAKAQQADVRAGYAAGADQYLTKPYSLFELLDFVEAAVHPAAS